MIIFKYSNKNNKIKNYILIWKDDYELEKFIKGKGRNIKIYKNNDILFDEIDDEIIGYNETNDIIIVFNKSAVYVNLKVVHHFSWKLVHL